MNRIISFVLLFMLASSAFAQQWEQTNGVGGDGTQSVAVNSQGHIFVAARALHRSTDGGVTWTRLFPEAPSDVITKVAVQPSGRIIISVGAQFPAITLTGIWGSDDNGNTWKKFSVTATTFFTGASASLYALNSPLPYQTTGMFRSNDNGDSWTALSIDGIIGNITCASQEGSGNLLVCAKYLYRSTNNGSSWGKIINGIDNNLNLDRIAIAPDGTPYVYRYRESGLFHSVDNGRTWEIINSDDRGTLAIGFNENTIFVLNFGGSGGVIRYSSDNGNTWTKPPLGDQQSSTVYTACAGESGGKFIFTLNNHLSRFDPIDPGNASLLSVPNGNITSMTSASDESIIAFSYSTNPTSNYYASYGWRSSNGGKNWLYLNTENTFRSFGNPSITVAESDSTGKTLCTMYGYILESSDGGFSWNFLRQTPITDGAITSVSINPDNWIFATTSSEGVFRSSDRGKTWDQLNSGISNQQLSCICADANGDVYTSGVSSIYRSTNNGIVWSSLPANFPANTRINSISVSKQGVLYAGTTSYVWMSFDRGQTWNVDSVTLPATIINKLLSTPDGKTFAGTDSGVYYTDNNQGSPWHLYSDGLSAKNVQTLCIDNKGHLYAGTDVSGIFKSKATFGTTTRGVTTNSSTTTFSLSAPFPNPASTSTTIPFSISEYANVRLDITDALGRIVAIVTDGVYEAGYHTLVFETRNLSPGVYYIRLRSGGKSEIRPIVKTE